jgi:dihydropteroate synthase
VQSVTALESSLTWKVAGRELSLPDVNSRRPLLAVIVNLTPDSFSDGGTWQAHDEARLEQIQAAVAKWAGQGVEIIDVGAESTRPGSQAVDVELEWLRLKPVVQNLVHTISDGPLISIDTRRGLTAHRALQMGAHIINDVSGLADPVMAETIARWRAGLIIGHLRGEPATMQSGIHFANLFAEVAHELWAACQRALAAGIERESIVVDPGLGFGKTPQQSAALLECAGWLEQQIGFPVMIGASRKRFLGEATGLGIDRRDGVSALAAVLAAKTGARVLRVHDVESTIHALDLLYYVNRATRDFAEKGSRDS